MSIFNSVFDTALTLLVTKVTDINRAKNINNFFILFSFILNITADAKHITPKTINIIALLPVLGIFLSDLVLSLLFPFIVVVGLGVCVGTAVGVTVDVGVGVTDGDGTVVGAGEFVGVGTTVGVGVIVGVTVFEGLTSILIFLDVNFTSSPS